MIKSGNVVYNIFIEPQFTILHEGTGQPKFQLFAGMNFQLPKSYEAAARMSNDSLSRPFRPTRGVACEHARQARISHSARGF